jgi:hypothetical protein
MTNKPGRPEKEFDWKILDSILQFGANLIDCSELLEVSEDTVQRKIKSEHGCTFTEYRTKKMGRMRVKLLQKQYEMAQNGNVALLIWLGKQYLGQSDKAESTLELSKVEINIDKKDSEL